ncbi:unnamed protein product [Gordionus sp. m RMFG-2023]
MENNRTFSIIKSPNEKIESVIKQNHVQAEYANTILMLNSSAKNDEILNPLLNQNNFKSKNLVTSLQTFSSYNTDPKATILSFHKSEEEFINPSITANTNNYGLFTNKNNMYTPGKFLNFANPNSNPGSNMLGSNFFPGTPITPATPSIESSGIVPQIQNIVSTVNLCCKLDLKKIALNARNAEYNPKRFAAVIMRIREPRTTALIFSSGKMVCTGAKSEEQSKLAARKYARIIQKLGFEAKFIDFKIQNMVGSCDVKFPIRLEGLVLTHSQFSSYEPELFPGKIVLTGAKVRAEIYQAFENIYPILKGFRKC